MGEPNTDWGKELVAGVKQLATDFHEFRTEMGLFRSKAESHMGLVSKVATMAVPTVLALFGFAIVQYNSLTNEAARNAERDRANEKAHEKIESDLAMLRRPMVVPVAFPTYDVKLPGGRFESPGKRPDSAAPLLVYRVSSEFHKRLDTIGATGTVTLAEDASKHPRIALLLGGAKVVYLGADLFAVRLQPTAEPELMPALEQLRGVNPQIIFRFVGTDAPPNLERDAPPLPPA